MATKEGGTAISPKEKEKLKQKLMNLLREHESKKNKKQSERKFLNKTNEQRHGKEEDIQQQKQQASSNREGYKKKHKNAPRVKGNQQHMGVVSNGNTKMANKKLNKNNSMSQQNCTKKAGVDAKPKKVTNGGTKDKPLKPDVRQKSSENSKKKALNKKGNSVQNPKSIPEAINTEKTSVVNGPKSKKQKGKKVEPEDTLGLAQKKNSPKAGSQKNSTKGQNKLKNVNMTKLEKETTTNNIEQNKLFRSEDTLPNSQPKSKKSNKLTTNLKKTDTSVGDKNSKVPLKENSKPAKESKNKKNKQKSQNSTNVNGTNSLNIKNQQNKAKKRVATETANTTNVSKKPKLTDEKPQVPVESKSKKSKKNNPSQGKTNSSTESKKLDTSNMPGFVKGGDFDSKYGDYSGDAYWQQQYANNFEDSEDDFGDHQQNNQEVETYNGYGESDDSDEDDPYNYSDIDDSDEDSDDNDPYNYSDIDENDENSYNYGVTDDEDDEEEERYSDFDEDDYEEDEDSYDYSDSENSSNYDEDDAEDADKSYDFEDEENDEDYKLPEDVPEDLIVHSGTATKRDIQPEDNVVFKDKKYCQIIELKSQTTVKTIQQPEGYKKEELLKLKYKENHIAKIEPPALSSGTKDVDIEVEDKNDDCPKLVPIIDEDDFQLYNPKEDEEETLDEESLDDEEQDAYEYDDDDSMENVSLGSEYTELDSDEADSLMSEDINEKYLNRNANDYGSSDDDDERMHSMQTVDIINATKCKYAADESDGNLKQEMDVNDDDAEKGVTPSQILNKHIMVGSKAVVVSIPIADKAKEEEKEQLNAENDSLNANPNVQAEKEIGTILKSNTSSNLLLNDGENNDETSTSHDEKPTDQVDGDENTSREATTTRAKIQHQNLTDYDTIFCNAINANLVLVLVKDPFYIYGTVRLTLLAGQVDVYGHSLSLNKEIELFSPRGCSVIEISSHTSAAKSSQNNLKQTFKSFDSNFLRSDLESIIKGYDPAKDAVVLLKRNDERRKVVSQFKKFMNENVFPNLQNINPDRPLFNSEYLLRCIINTSAMEQKCLRLSDQWKLLEVSRKSRILLAGGKGVGKSTLLRYLINKELQSKEKVLLIDLDIGQPEIFVPQTVSCAVVTKPLLGPGFFLNQQPEKAFAVGHTNIALCAHRYIEAVQQLIDYCLAQNHLQDIPWFVNTMGYNKGFGLELISVIIKSLPLTDVIQLQSNKAINNFDTLLFPQNINQVPCNMFMEYNGNPDEESPILEYRTHVWQTAVTQESRYQKEWDMSPKDTRYAMLLTRLSVALQGHAEWLTDCKPLSAPLDQLKLINLMDNKPPCSQDELAKAMEANLVYLCHAENERSAVECLGIGVVRAIDYHVRQVYLIPAIFTPLLKHVNCLALGDMPLPSSMLTNQGSRINKTAPFVYNTVEANASKAIKQIYHRPKLFLSGKHKSLD
ncbi:polynucleotide 5'-hydroxyl-kinase NOL9-like isoform X2 [Musca domestica]|uniref:Polynucleotide 5'-hydroxyl-kinase NOL9 n=1 Tax=Musca domestica TaxID=7370 RepID=A0ABM3UQU9_MUSDO|nr:polynucleotide 5'-hydroxyl-kinase NOL9-like isoform X2 [Musca domestica]